MAKAQKDPPVTPYSITGRSRPRSFGRRSPCQNGLDILTQTYTHTRTDTHIYTRSGSYGVPPEGGDYCNLWFFSIEVRLGCTTLAPHASEVDFDQQKPYDFRHPHTYTHIHTQIHIYTHVLAPMGSRLRGGTIATRGFVQSKSASDAPRWHPTHQRWTLI